MEENLIIYFASALFLALIFKGMEIPAGVAILVGFMLAAFLMFVAVIIAKIRGFIKNHFVR